MTSQILGTIRVSRSGQTRIADITGVNRDPEFAAAAANAVAQAYLTSQVEAKTSRTDASGAFINTRLKELETNALNAQARLDTYKSDRGLVGAQGLTSADQEVRLLNTQVSTAEADFQEKQAKLDTARSQLEKKPSICA